MKAAVRVRAILFRLSATSFHHCEDAFVIIIGIIANAECCNGQWNPMHISLPGEKRIPCTLSFGGIQMPGKTVRKLQVLPPFSSYPMGCMNRFAGAVKAKLMVTQRKHADDLSDRRNAATNCSHAENEAQGVLRVASSQ